MVARSDRSVSVSSDEGFGLGELMPRAPSPPPPPFTFADYDVPADLRGRVGGRETLRVRLVGSHPLWGHYLWNTARVLTSHLLSHPSYYAGKRTLELGAGAALPSLACALGGAAAAVATDYNDESLLDNMRFNAEANGARVEVLGHTWGTSVRPLIEAGRVDGAGADGGGGVAGEDGRYDLVILSDLVFNHSQHDALIKTLDATLSLAPPPSPSPSSATPSSPPTPSSPGPTPSAPADADFASLPTTPLPPSPTPCALVFITHHRPHLADADLAFFARLQASAPGRWGVARVVEEWAGAMFADDRGDAKVRGTVHGFRVWRL